MAKFGEHVCPSCGEKQWSINDNRYLDLWGICWAEDRKKWEDGKLSLEEFEERELQAANATDDEL